jgi:hypothetical protein
MCAGGKIARDGGCWAHRETRKREGRASGAARGSIEPGNRRLLLRVAEESDGPGSAITNHDTLNSPSAGHAGQILEAMRKVLVEAPEGLRTVEIWDADPSAR